MKTFALILVLAGLVTSVQAQSDATPVSPMLVLKNGQSVPATDFSRKDDSIMIGVITPSGGKGQVAYSVSDIAQLKMPEPPELAAAASAQANGHPDQALALLQPALAFQQTLRDLPGNWWAQTALAETSVLVALHRTGEAEPLLKEIMSTSNDHEIQVGAKLQLALIDPPKDPVEALAAYDAVIKQSSDPSTLTQAWMEEGDIHFAQHEFLDSLLSYMTVLVFYPDHNAMIPKALWGSAQCYGKLKDTVSQEKAWQQLITDYAATPEASLAKAALLKKKNLP